MGRFEMSNWLAGPRAADSSLRRVFARLTRLWDTPRLSGLIRSQEAAWKERG